MQTWENPFIAVMQSLCRAIRATALRRGMADRAVAPQRAFARTNSHGFAGDYIETMRRIASVTLSRELNADNRK